MLTLSCDGHAPTAQTTPAFSVDPDAYGGVRMGAAAATGRFQVKQLGARWMLVTPEGNGMWVFGVYHVDVDEHVDDLGDTYKNRVIRKYGDADVRWGPQQNRRLKSWGFNVISEYANTWVTPWAQHSYWGGGQPVKLPAVPFPVQAGSYSQRNLFGYANQPVKELYWAMDSHYRDYRGHFPDVFDPNFDLWVSRRLTSAEFAGYASSPWTIGISSDDTDYLTGFGPGPDFPAEQGNTHPHLGYVVLITPPTQSVSQDGMTRYTDPTVYTKQALGDFLRSKYSTIDALNAAWGSNYTSFGSNGGWGSGTGLLDENGSGSWVGTNATTLSNTNPQVKADLDAFLYQIALRYFSVYRTRITRYYPGVMFLGPTTVGGWGCPPRKEILQAAKGNVDMIRTQLNLDNLQGKVDFIASHAGNVPLVLWLGKTANPDSAMFRYSGSELSSQAARGSWYSQTVQGLFNVTTSTTRVKPIIGIQWWEHLDNWAEKANWGLISLSDNAYDGREAVRSTGRDPWGFPTGGEERDHGDFISAVRSTNKSVTDQLASGAN